MRAAREEEISEIIRLAFIRLGLLATVDRSASPEDMAFARRFYRAGMDDADMARVLAPYYPQKSARKYEGQFAWNPPTNCLKCGNAVYYALECLRYMTNRMQADLHKMIYAEVVKCL